jgi:hypothetical protein
MNEVLPGPIRRTLTNDEGKFFFGNVNPGHYVVMARADGYEPSTVPASVMPGRVTYVTLKLRPILTPTPTPVPGTGDIEGHVAYARGGALIPIPSAHLVAVRLNNETDEMIGHNPVHHTATDEFGFYRFEKLLIGRYLVMAGAEGFNPAKQEGTVWPDETTVIDFILEPLDEPTSGTGTIFGRVVTYDEPTTPGIRPPVIPLEGANILVLRVCPSLSDEEMLVPAGRAVTDEGGMYIVDNLPRGIYVVIAKKQGYSWGIKKARVRPLSETRVNFLLVPLDRPEPEAETDPVFENDFEYDDESWEPSGVPDFYDMPEAVHKDGRLILECNNNINTFGYWHSPRDAIPLSPDAIYRATFALSSDVTDLTQVPCIRIRFNSQSEQVADMMVVNSMGDAVMSPGPEGRIYTHYFTLPSQDICLPLAEDDIYVSFDLANIDDGDAANATVSLDWVKIESIPLSALTKGTEVAAFDFTIDKHGWDNQFADGLFTPADAMYAPDIESLALKARNNVDTYGAWVSPPGVVNMEADTLYSIAWEFFSDQADTSSVPGLRFRAGDDDNRLIIQKCIFSNAEGDNSPDGMGRGYTLYYTAPIELEGIGLYLAFDLVNFAEDDAEDAVIGLRSVTVRAIPTDQIP